MGHFESNLAQVKHVDICPHSKIKQSIGLDIQMLQSSESGTFDSSGRKEVISFCVAWLADDESLVLLREEDGTSFIASREKLFCKSIVGAEAIAQAVSE